MRNKKINLLSYTDSHFDGGEGGAKRGGTGGEVSSSVAIIDVCDELMVCSVRRSMVGVLYVDRLSSSAACSTATTWW